MSYYDKKEMKIRQESPDGLFLIAGSEASLRPYTHRLRRR